MKKHSFFGVFDPIQMKRKFLKQHCEMWMVMLGVMIDGEGTRQDMEKAERVVRGRRKKIESGARGEAEQNRAVLVGFRAGRGIPLSLKYPEFR